MPNWDLNLAVAFCLASAGVLFDDRMALKESKWITSIWIFRWKVENKNAYQLSGSWQVIKFDLGQWHCESTDRESERKTAPRMIMENGVKVVRSDWNAKIGLQKSSKQFNFAFDLWSIILIYNWLVLCALKWRKSNESYQSLADKRPKIWPN